MRTVHVQLGPRSYSVLIGAGALDELPQILAGLTDSRQLVVVADAEVARLHWERLVATLPVKPVLIEVLPGEDSKSLVTLGRLYDALAAARVERTDVLITFGGGVIGDLGGFAAGTWHRGMRFVQVPTTLEAAIDASVGGKTALNHPSGKNLIGVFHQPSAVVVDTRLLETLPIRELRAGLAESVKHALLADASGADRSDEFLSWHEHHAPEILAREHTALEELIARNCAIKAAVVSQDEREAGLRAILNYGHTIGHALEHVLGYRLRHGECVALGIIVANELSVQRDWLEPQVAERTGRLLERLGLPVRLAQAVPPEDVIAACRMDKKVHGGRVHFILLRGLGQPVRVSDVAPEEIQRAMACIQPRE